MPKSKFKKVLLLAAAVLFVAVLCAVIFHDREPMYQGKSLSDWIVVTAEHPRDEHAHQVVRQLGSNNVPVLLEWLRRQDHPTVRGLALKSKAQAIEWLEAHAVKKPMQHKWPKDWKSSYQSMAMTAFDELGPSAKEAIPTLIKMLDETDSKTGEPSKVAYAAFCSLTCLAPDSIQPLTQALESTNRQVGFMAAGALDWIGPRAKAAIPVLKKLLTNEDLEIWLQAANVMGDLGGDPEEFVPVLIEAVPRIPFYSGPVALRFTLHDLEGSLVKYKSYAKPAVPLLKQLYDKIPDDSFPANYTYRRDILSAIQKIDPEGAEEISRSTNTPQ